MAILTYYLPVDQPYVFLFLLSKAEFPNAGRRGVYRARRLPD